jgi:hypothetical protein
VTPALYHTEKRIQRQNPDMPPAALDLIATGQEDFRFVERFPELLAKVLVGCMNRFRAREEPTRLIAAPQSQ